MANPPEEVQPSALFRKLLERPAPSEVFDLPMPGRNGGTHESIRIQVLRMDQHDDARDRADMYLRTKRKLSDERMRSPLGVELLGDATARELLAMACTAVDPVPGTEEDKPVYARIFMSGEEVGKLSADEVTVLFGAYMLVQRKFGPYERGMNDDEVNAWVERLVRGASELPLSALASAQLAELVMRLAQRASSFSSILGSQRQSLPINWGSIPESWGFGMSFSTEPAAVSTHSSDEAEQGRTITAEDAMNAARAFSGT